MNFKFPAEQQNLSNSEMYECLLLFYYRHLECYPEYCFPDFLVLASMYYIIKIPFFLIMNMVRIAGNQFKIEELNKPKILEKELKQSIFLFRLSEKSLEVVQLILLYILKWNKSLKEISEKILKKIFVKVCNENKFRVYLINNIQNKIYLY